MFVQVYKNLHNGKYSIRAAHGKHKGLVIGHASEIHLEDAKFKVNESGRQRVIKTGQKNVHAYVQGNLVCVTDWNERYPTQVPTDHVNQMYDVPVTYNPYKFTSFVTRDQSCRVVHTASHVRLDDAGIHISR